MTPKNHRHRRRRRKGPGGGGGYDSYAPGPGPGSGYGAPPYGTPGYGDAGPAPPYGEPPFAPDSEPSEGISPYGDPGAPPAPDFGLGLPPAAPPEAPHPDSRPDGRYAPRGYEPRYADPRHADPRHADPRYPDPRSVDPRYAPRQDFRAARPPAAVYEGTVQGIVELQRDQSAFLRFMRNDMLPGPDDVFVPHPLVRRYDLRDGALVEGPIAAPSRSGQRPGLREVVKVDGMTPDEARRLPRFGDLTVIDPDFHYEFGDAGDISLRVLDLLCPVGRGQRGLIVAPPRTGKTIFLHKVAQAMEQLYPDVHLMVLLVDERPEEGTAWKRLVKGDVFLSTLDQGTRHHVQLAEAAFRRAIRLVECNKDVMLLLDSITRMSRSYNAEIGNSGRIMTGGIDSRTMEKPKRMFGAARNTEEGGSLTILGTALVDTGSRMDQVIFEEFKGTGNMELVLSRPLADRRIFPAFDIGLSGTRKEEKLISPAKLRRIVTLRRVLQKMKPIEAMEQLLRKLERTPNNEEFLRQFELSGVD